MQRQRVSVIFMCVFLCVAAARALGSEPGAVVDLRTLGDTGDRLKGAADRPVNAYPWEGKHVVYFTMSDKLDGKVMEGFIKELDACWELCVKATGRTPEIDPPAKKRVPRIRPHFNGKAVVGLSATLNDLSDRPDTIDLRPGQANFFAAYDWTDEEYPWMKAKRTDIAPYFLTTVADHFDLRESPMWQGPWIPRFLTAYCFKQQKLTAKKETWHEHHMAKLIACEAKFARSKLTWEEAFFAPQGKRPEGVDPDAMMGSSGFASIMLVLSSENGAEFVPRFFQQLDTMPELPFTNKDYHKATAGVWAITASIAARKNLGPAMVKRWKFPLSKETLSALAKLKYKDESLRALDVAMELFASAFERPRSGER